MNETSQFDVVVGIDMETDIGSFTAFYRGVQQGTPRLLDVLDKNQAKATFFWTGHAAQNNPAVVRQVRRAGHETGCHGLYHETLGDALFELPNNWPILPEEAYGRIRRGTEIVRKISGVRPRSFRCPRLWGSTAVCNALEKLGYAADASLPLYYYGKPIAPYHPSSKDWTKPGKMKLVQIPNFCDLTMKSRDPKYHRDRDQWPLFRTQGAGALLEKVAGFVKYVQAKRQRPVVCLYFHPWEFATMPSGELAMGEGWIRPLPFIVQNCGLKALKEFDRFCAGVAKMGGMFKTCLDVAREYRRNDQWPMTQ